MPHGTQSTIEHLAQRLLQRWVPKWYEAFTEGLDAGFHERLGHSFKPIKTGQRRLLTQCRQLSIYCDAVTRKANPFFQPDLRAHFNFIKDVYYNADTEGWHFAIDDEGQLSDKTHDLYVTAFVIFAFAHYYRATKDENAKRLAEEAVTFIDKNFRYVEGRGFYEALDKTLKPLDKTRRHESHMHLLEACLFAAQTWEDVPAFMIMADDLVRLFEEGFYNADQNLLSEYYSDDLNPLAEKGHVILEPGHYCEWIWLLKKYETLKDQPSRYDTLCLRLLGWANDKGWDAKYGGIYDEIAPDGTVIEDTKRIWPFTEALKANALMLDAVDTERQALKKRIHKMVKVFKSHYIEQRGFWTEWLTRDLQPATDYMPGTTPYHVYFGITEAKDVLNQRGPTKSLSAGILMFLYSVRQRLSGWVREIRLKVKQRANQ